MQEPYFTLEARRRGGTLCLSLEGDLDWPVVGELWEALDLQRQAPTDHLVLDLSAIDFLDAAGLRALLAANRRGRETGCDVTVVRPKGLASRVFTLTRAGSELSLVDGP